jgi:hypothetical protein
LLQDVSTTTRAGKKQRRSVVGLLVGVIGWDTFFSNILHPGSNGMMVVLHDSCGHADFTYRLDGPDAILMGAGDLHDTNYDGQLEYSTEFAPFLQMNTNATDSSFDEVVTKDKDSAHGNEHCGYTLVMYPSQDMQDLYTTHRPVLYASIVVLVFLATTMVFLLFDCVVAIRQRRILAKAKRTHAIVLVSIPRSRPNDSRCRRRN